jgi:uncharacterized phage infection (PIP) family protein YhgE
MLSEKKEINNSISGNINRQLSKLIQKIPDSKEINKMIPKLGRALEKISPETVKAINNIAEKKIN